MNRWDTEPLKGKKKKTYSLIERVCKQRRGGEEGQKEHAGLWEAKVSNEGLLPLGPKTGELVITTGLVNSQETQEPLPKNQC